MNGVQEILTEMMEDLGRVAQLREMRMAGGTPAPQDVCATRDACATRAGLPEVVLTILSPFIALALLLLIMVMVAGRGLGRQ